jgi:hypothetical protein
MASVEQNPALRLGSSLQLLWGITRLRPGVDHRV